MSPENASFFGVLDRARLRLRRAAVIECWTYIGAAALLSLAVAGVAVHWGAPRIAVALLEFLIFGACLVFSVRRYLRRRRTRFIDRAAAASWLDAQTDSGARFRGAVELNRDRGKYAESRELVDAAITAAATAVFAVQSGPMLRRTVVSWVRPSLLALCIGGVAAGGLWRVAPGALSSALGVWSQLGTLDEAIQRETQDPRLSSLKLSYRFPSYSARPPRTERTAHGQIRALPGTEVTIEAFAPEALRKATLIVRHGEEERRIQAKAEGRRVTATLVVSRGGAYRFRTVNEADEEKVEAGDRQIHIEFDAPPSVTITSPTATPMEVTGNETFEIGFRARDDFALGDAFLRFRVLETTREGRLPLSTASRGRKQFSGRESIELSTLSLQSGDRVAYWVEVEDNDNVGGPKVGSSGTQELEVYSEEKHHREVLQAQAEALDELVHVLGDNLENQVVPGTKDRARQVPIPRITKIIARAEKAADLAAAAANAIDSDPLAKPGVAAAFLTARTDLRRDTGILRKHLGSVRRRGVSPGPDRRLKGSQARMVSNLEKNAVYLADLLNEQRLLDAEALTEQLREAQEELRQAIENYRDAPDEAKRKIIRQAIEEIKARVQQIAKELQKVQSSIPQDFVNSEALQQKDTEAQLEALERLIDEGQLDQAMTELDQMLAETEQMLSQMQEGREELSEREYGDITEKAEALWKSLQEMQADQAALAEKTNEIAESSLEQMAEALKESDDEIAALLRDIARAKSALLASEGAVQITSGGFFDRAVSRMDNASEALEATDFGSASDAVIAALKGLAGLSRQSQQRLGHSRRFGSQSSEIEDLESGVENVAKSQALMQKVKKALEDLMPEASETVSKAQGEALEQQAKGQRALEKQGDALSEKLNELGQKLPIVGPDMYQRLGQAMQAMQESAKGLQEHDAPGAHGSQMRALDALKQFQESLQEMAKGGDGQGPGVPLPFQPPSAQGEGREGRGHKRNQRYEQVDIPKPEQFQPPAEFRKEILDAAKEGTVESYRDAVRRYYEEIVK